MREVICTVEAQVHPESGGYVRFGCRTFKAKIVNSTPGRRFLDDNSIYLDFLSPTFFHHGPESTAFARLTLTKTGIKKVAKCFNITPNKE